MGEHLVGRSPWTAIGSGSATSHSNSPGTCLRTCRDFWIQQNQSNINRLDIAINFKILFWNVVPHLIIRDLIKIPGKLSSVLPKQISFIWGGLGEGGQISLKASERCNLC